MANYSIVVDTSNFKPFDIATPLTVLRDYRDAYYRYEDALNKIAEENGQFVLPEPDENNAQQKSIFDTYNKYNDDFRRISDDFSKGMNWENSQWVRSINRRYGSEVKPIKQAVQDFNTWQDNMNNIRAQVGGSAIIDNDDLTVYDFYGGKKPKLKFANGDKIAEKAQKYFSGYLEATKESPVPVKSAMEGYFELVSGGISPEKAAEIQNAKYENLTGNYDGSMKDLLLGLKDIVDRDTEGFSLPSKKKAFGYAIQGAISGIPKKEIAYQKDLSTDLAQQRLSMDETRQRMRINALEEPYKIAGYKADVRRKAADAATAEEEYRWRRKYGWGSRGTQSAATSNDWRKDWSQEKERLKAAAKGYVIDENGRTVARLDKAAQEKAKAELKNYNKTYGNLYDLKYDGRYVYFKLERDKNNSKKDVVYKIPKGDVEKAYQRLSGTASKGNSNVQTHDSGNKKGSEKNSPILAKIYGAGYNSDSIYPLSDAELNFLINYSQSKVKNNKFINISPYMSKEENSQYKTSYGNVEVLDKNGIDSFLWTSRFWEDVPDNTALPVISPDTIGIQPPPKERKVPKQGGNKGGKTVGNKGGKTVEKTAPTVNNPKNRIDLFTNE